MREEIHHVKLNLKKSEAVIYLVTMLSLFMSRKDYFMILVYFVALKGLGLAVTYTN